MLNKPSSWLLECLTKIENKRNKLALDLACGYGRNSFLLSKEGYKVFAVDNDEKKLSKIVDNKIITKRINIEETSNWPILSEKFDLIVVINYLYRPIFPDIASSLNNNGYLVYETFVKGHSKYGAPKNKNYLLENRELVGFANCLSLIAYEDINVESFPICFKKQRVFLKNV